MLEQSLLQVLAAASTVLSCAADTSCPVLGVQVSAPQGVLLVSASTMKRLCLCHALPKAARCKASWAVPALTDTGLQHMPRDPAPSTLCQIYSLCLAGCGWSEKGWLTSSLVLWC